jgi:hypothetical protein
VYGKTKNILLTQLQMRHSSPSTTTVYTHISGGEIQDAMDGLSDPPSRRGIHRRHFGASIPGNAFSVFTGGRIPGI